MNKSYSIEEVISIKFTDLKTGETVLDLKPVDIDGEIVFKRKEYKQKLYKYIPTYYTRISKYHEDNKEDLYEPKDSITCGSWIS